MSSLEFSNEASRLDAERGAALARRRERQQYALIAAVLGSMLIWAATAVVFARSIGRRLEVLTGNAERLGSGRQLAAPLSGSDEIAALDAVLHQTGARLREAESEQALLKARLEARAGELAGVNEELRQETQDNEMFIYSVSHDLRSPLVNLQGFSKELQVSCDELDSIVEAAKLPEAEHRRMAHILDCDVRESLQYLRTAVTRAAAIIDALLRISRAGRLEYQWQRVSVGREVGRVVDALQGAIRQHAAVVTVRELPPAWGDPGAIEQIFSNLIGNALNYLDPARSGRIEVGALDPEPVDETELGARWPPPHLLCARQRPRHSGGVYVEGVPGVSASARRRRGWRRHRPRGGAADGGTARRPRLGRVGGRRGVDLFRRVAGTACAQLSRDTHQGKR